MSPRSLLRRTAALALAAVALAGCAGGEPTREEFAAKMRESLGEDLIAEMKDRGIAAREVDEIIERFLSCTYDSLKTDLAVLQRAYDAPGDVLNSPEIDSRAIECVNQMTSAVTEAADPAPPTTAPPTTPTTLPSDGSTSGPTTTAPTAIGSDSTEAPTTTSATATSGVANQ